MANKDPSRTEKVTSKKLAKERDKGNVLSCPDLNSLVTISAGTLLLFITVPFVADAFRYILSLQTDIDCRESWTLTEMSSGSLRGFLMMCKILAPACIGVCLIAIIIMRVQIGKFFSFEPLKWRFDKLWNPSGAFGEILPNAQSSINLGIATLKVLIVGYFIYLTIRNEFGELLKLNMMPVLPGALWVAKSACILALKIMGVFIFVVAISFWHKWKQYYDNLMMTKQEVKDEHKDMDGDPRVKAKIRSKMREMFFRIMMGNMKNADVLVTNPTHVSVALRYDPEKDGVPVVIAKGLRKRALRLRFLANVYGVPIVEAPPLARSLYRNVKMGAPIPPEFYRAVAAILAKLHKSGRKKMLLKKSA